MQRAGEGSDVETLTHSIGTCLHESVAVELPVIEVAPQRPWIRPATLEFIVRRNAAGREGSRSPEIELQNKVTKSAKEDRKVWTEGLLATGSWDELRRFRRQLKPQISGRKLANRFGQAVETNERSQTFAEHLENTQWAARQLSPLERQDPLGAQLASEDGDITAEELSTAIRQLKNKRAAVQIPAEYLKAVVDSDNAGDAWILKLMRRCWATKTTPESWHLAEV